MAFNYEEAEARAVESAKAAVKEVRRKIEAYDRLEAAARAVVDNGGYGAFVTDWAGKETCFNLVPAHLYDALRAAVEESPE